MIANFTPRKFESYLQKFMEQIQILCLDGNSVRIEKITSTSTFIT
jgi:hypothetical protein